MKTAVGYLRLSKFDEDTTNPQRQRQALKRMAKERGWRLREPIYEDIDVSGWNGAHRPGLEAMLAELGDVDVVAVYRIDRLARSQQEFVRVLDKLKEADVELAASDMTLDNTPNGTFVRDLIARLAQLESDNISAASRPSWHTKGSAVSPWAAPPPLDGSGWESTWSATKSNRPS